MNLPTSMTAAVLFKLNSNLKILNLEIPKLKKGQVLVKVFYSAICRSQIEEIYSGRENKKFLPHLLGHEGSGKVLAVGRGVSKIKVGDDVILTWINSKGLDSVNPEYFYKNKKINSGKVTTFSNYTIVSENRLVRKPKYINFKNAVLLGCCLMTGSGMVFNDLKIKKNNKIVVIGLGAVGLSVLLSLKKLGIKNKNIVLIENNKKKIFIAKKIGIKKIFNKINNITTKEIFKFFKDKADICFESAGKTKTIEYAMKIIKKDGRVHFASHPNFKDYIKIYPHDLISGKKISGTWGGGCLPDRDVSRSGLLIKVNSSLFKKILNKEYNLNNINKAVHDFKKNDIFRPIIRMEH
jgi:S-(hydroxymethyl)glutathione dehydrogenase/alcohol dehydrogenase